VKAQRKIRPGTGRGTIHRMVEGRERSERGATAPHGRGPSVTPPARHLPVPERNFLGGSGVSNIKLPLVLSLSKDRLRTHRSYFDKLSTNGEREAVE